jgi:hypothetical protein
MALWICSACDRHVQPNASRCPFCDTALGTTSALPQRMMMVAAFGLALAGCGDDGAPAEAPTSGGATTTATATDTDSTGMGSTSTTASDPDAGGEDYAGAETGPWGEEEESAEEWGGTTSIDTTGTDTDTGSESTGTDTGSTSSDTEDDAGGQDYAGPETDI